MKRYAVTSGNWRPLRWAMASLMLVISVVLFASAQESAPTTPVEERSLPKILSEGPTDRSLLRELERSSLPQNQVQAIWDGLDRDESVLRERIDEALAELESEETLSALVDLENVWLRETNALKAQVGVVADRAVEVEEALSKLGPLDERWKWAEATARELRAPKATRDEIANMLARLRDTRELLATNLSRLLGLESKLGKRLDRVGQVLARVQESRTKAREVLLATGTRPLWTALAQWDTETSRGWAPVIRSLSSAYEYAKQKRDVLIFYALLIALGVGLVVALRRQAPEWASEDHRIERATALLRRPVSASLLMTFPLIFVFFSESPTVFRSLFAVLPMLAFIRVIPMLIEREARLPFYAVGLFFLFDRVRDLLVTTPLVARISFEVELGAAVAVTAWTLAPARLDLFAHGTSRRLLQLGLRTGLAVLTLALTASVFGYEGLATVLGGGALRAAYVGVVAFSAYRLLGGVVPMALRTRTLRRLRAVRHYGGLIGERCVSLLGVGLWLLWIERTLEGFQLRAPLEEWISTALGATLSLGAVEVSVGDVFALVIAIIASIYLSRLVRFVLEEDVMSRLQLPRGVPQAISTTAGYVVLLVGFMLALAAGGIDVGRLSILAGALGVGIGFGLQNVVNNFVSGLILIFERPVQVGDTIEVGNVLGRVRRIGIRSSTVRTLDGAEVIVPNGSLISDQVVNWTLSDRQRRIELDLGVAYGTDPVKVLQLLRDVVQHDDRLLRDPEPQALFVGFGDSSLDFLLRVWTAQYDDWIPIRSDLRVAVHQALGDAGIEIPFPQRDLHLRSSNVDLGTGRTHEGS